VVVPGAHDSTLEDGHGSHDGSGSGAGGPEVGGQCDHPHGHGRAGGLLALGVVGPLFYLASDALLGARWEGYSYAGQVVSEWFAVDAPTRSLAVPLFVAYGVLAIAFGVGVCASAGGRRALRVVGAGLILKEVFGIVATVVAPMHMRGAGATLSDTWHGILTMLGAICYLLVMGFGAAAFGQRFRLYSIATMMLLTVLGILAGMEHARIAENLPTPTVGLWERIDIYATMVWIAVLAVTLLRRPGGRSGLPWAGRGDPDSALPGA
jgi:hypothetical protein